MTHALVALTLLAMLSGCGVAPVRKDGDPSLPPQWTYVGVHGRPLAYNGGVCALSGVHKHDYPPAPRAAFEQTPQGLRDTRKTWAFFDLHAHHGRTCFRVGWHLHLEAPDPALTFDDASAAWRDPRAAQEFQAPPG